jgi:hypothetical protein
MWTSGRWPGKGALRFASESAQRMFVWGYSDAGIHKSISVALWMKPTLDRYTHTVLAVWNKDGFSLDPSRSLFLLLLRDQGLALEIADGKKFPRIVKRESAGGTESTVDDGWVHVAFTIEAGGDIRFYKNGQEVDRNGRAYPLAALSGEGKPLVLGGREPGGSCLDAVVDELAVFRRVLSPGEIQEMYEAGKPDGHSVAEEGAALGQ